MKIFTHSYLMTICLFISINSSTAQTELEIEWFCPRECSNINDGILIGATVKNVTAESQQFFFSIQHTEFVAFFQSVDDLVGTTSPTLDQSMILTIEPEEETFFAVLYAANIGSHDLTMTTQILDGPFWQQPCRVQISQSTETDLKLDMVVNGEVIEQAPVLRYQMTPVKAAIDAVINPAEFNQLNLELFGVDINYSGIDQIQSRGGGQEINLPLNEPFDLVFTATNLGVEPAMNIQFFAELPINFTVVEFVTDNVDQEKIIKSSNGLVLPLVFDQLDPGQLITVHAILTADATGQGTIGGDVSTCSYDASKANNRKCADFIIEEIATPKADIAVTKTSDQLYYRSKDTVCFTIEITNNGPDDAPAVTIEDALPEQIDFLSAEGSRSPEIAVTDNVVIAQWEVIRNGETETLTIKALVSSSTSDTIQNVVLVQPPQTYEDPNSDNDFDATTLILEALYGLHINQYSITEPLQAPNSLEGFISVEYDEIPELNFLNVYMVNPENGDEDWVLQNAFLFPTDNTETIDFTMNFGNLGFIDGQPIPFVDLQFEVTDIPLIEFPVDPNNFQSFPVLLYDYHVFNGVLDVSLVQFEEVPNPDIRLESDLFCLEYRREKDINVDLNKNEHPATDSYAGDQNACGPASAANSFEWMERRGLIPPNISHREKLEELSGLMMREDADGVFTGQFVKGKLGFIDKYRLPVTVEYQTNLPGVPNVIKSPNPNTKNVSIRKDSMSKDTISWQFLVDAMKAGKGVEIDYSWLKLKGDSVVARGAHLATVVGIGEAFGLRRIALRDDGDQCAEGGLNPNRMFSWIDHDGKAFLNETTNGNCRYLRKVRSVVTQCFDPNVSHYLQDLLLQVNSPTSVFPIVTDAGRFFVKFIVQPNNEVVLVNALTEEPLGDGQRRQEHNWLMRNLVLPPSSTFDTISLWLNASNTVLSTASIQDTFRFDLHINSSVSTTDSFDIQYSPVSAVEPMNIQQPSGSNSPADGPIELPAAILPTFNDQDAITYHLLSSRAQQVDIDSTKIGGWAQDGIASMASAFHHITNISDLDSMSLFNKFSLFQHAKSSEGTISRQQLIETTLGLIDSMQIPISLAFQSIEFGHDSIASPNEAYGHFAINRNGILPSKLDWEWFTTQIDNEIPVILEFGYYDEAGMRGGGHWVVAYGYTEVGNNRSFHFLDDLDQTQEGGTGKFIAYWDENDQITFVNPLSGPGFAVRIESAVTAQYDSSVEFMTTGTSENAVNAIHLLPNPAHNEIIVSGELPDHGPYRIELYNSLGQQVLSLNQSIGSHLGSKRIPVSQLPKGTYFLQVIQHEFRAIRKFIKQ